MFGAVKQIANNGTASLLFKSRSMLLRGFSSTPATKVAPQIITTEIPPALDDHIRQSLIERQPRVPFDRNIIEQERRKFQNFLRKEQSCQEILRATVALQKNEASGLYILNSLEPLDQKTAALVDLDFSLNHQASVDSDRKKQEILQKISQETPNILFLTKIFDLCGFSHHNNRYSLGDKKFISSFYVLEDKKTQYMHTDGPPEGPFRGEELIDLTCLTALESGKAAIYTQMVSAEDVVKKLSPGAIKLLQKNIFSEYKFSVLKKDVNGSWKLTCKPDLLFIKNPIIAGDDSQIIKSSEDSLRELMGAFSQVLGELHNVAQVNLEKGQQLAFVGGTPHRRYNPNGDSKISNATPNTTINATTEKSKTKTPNNTLSADGLSKERVLLLTPFKKI